MRFLVAGLVLVSLAIGLSEYSRRHPTGQVEAPSPAAAPARPPLLDTDAAPAENAAPIEPFEQRLAAPGDVTPQSGFVPVVRGDFAARALRGGFSAVLFVVDDKGSSAIVRAVAGEGAKVVAARPRRVDVMQVDGSTVFFAEGGTVLSTTARGDEAPQVRVHFKRAVVTSLAPVGDTVFLTLMPTDVDPLTEKPVGAVVKVGSDGQPQLVAAEQVHPSDVAADGKDVFWVSGAPSSLWRAPVDGAFSSQLAADAMGPLALDSDGVVFRSTGGELRRTGRSAGAPTVLANETPESFIVSSGLVRFITRRALFEVVAGGKATELFAPAGTPRGVAQAGTTLYLLVDSGSGTTTLYAK